MKKQDNNASKVIYLYDNTQCQDNKTSLQNEVRQIVLEGMPKNIKKK